MTEPAPDPILDIRDEKSFQAGHAPGAVNIPAEQIKERTHELPPKGSTIRLFDIHPDRLAVTELALRRQGYEVRREHASGSDLTETGPSRVRLWRPSPFLVEAMEHISSLVPAAAANGIAAPSRALDIACGAGREAVYLAMRGYQVDAIDVLPDALRKAEDLARRSGVLIRTIQQDLKRRPILPEAAYGLVAVFRFLHRPLLPAIARSVAPGGFLVYETFQREGPTLPRLPGRRDPGPPYAVADGELPEAFAEFQPMVTRNGVPREGRRFSQFLGRTRG